MADYPIPTVGATGYYRLKPPFDGLLSENDRYTCRAVRSITDCLANNENIKDTVYIKNGLTEADYNGDLANGVYIVSLQSDVGQWIYLPASYILGYPTTNGVEYYNALLAVNIGSIPTRLDLSTIKESISNLVYDTMGITPDIQTVQLSKVALIPEETHADITTARLNRATVTLSDSGRLRATQLELERALTKLHALENYILANLDVLPH